jgi:hypothetical protein
LGFGSVTSLGVPERGRDEDCTRKFIVRTESADFGIEKLAPLLGEASLVCFVAFSQSQLASIVLREPKPSGD